MQEFHDFEKALDKFLTLSREQEIYETMQNFGELMDKFRNLLKKARDGG